MRSKDEWRVSFATIAAIAGTGLIPGRAIALFFGQLKTLAWLGVGAASVLFGVLTAGTVWHSRMYGGDAMRREGTAASRLAGILRGLFSALLIAVMLIRVGEVSALTLPLRHAYGFGAVFALIAAVLLSLENGRLLPIAGFIAFFSTTLFYAAMALDPRPVRLAVRVETEFRLAGRSGAALLLATLFAAMNACAAGLNEPELCSGRPVGAGMRSGCMLFAVLTLGCLALKRGGDVLLAQPEPWVLLSARWGIAGFWICAGTEYLCALLTLAVALRALLLRVRAGSGGMAKLYLFIITALLFGVLSYGKL